MRPKIVILILVVAVGLVALAVAMKGVMGGRNTQEVKAPEPAAEEPAAPANTNQQASVSSTNSAAILEQLRAADLAKELDQVRELLADGVSSPHAAGALLGKVTHREPEVRKAALEALVQLNDTNSIPGLEQACTLIEDPHEKVALMDAIAYLKLPSSTTPEGAQEMTNTTESAAPAIMPGGGASNQNRFIPRKQVRQKGGAPKPAAPQPAAPANSETQPTPAVPETTPPQ
jgi:hypothetical protein